MQSLTVVANWHAAHPSLPWVRPPAPEDDAQAVLFPASEHAKSITGRPLVRDCVAAPVAWSALTARNDFPPLLSNP